MSSQYPNATFHPFGAGFCSDPLWDLKLSWYTDAPRLSECFLQTVLVWVPCVFLWIMAPFDMYTIMSSKENVSRWTWLPLTKLVFCSFLVCVALTDFIEQMIRYSKDQDSVLISDIIAPVIKLVTVVLAAVQIFLNRKRGLRSSGSLFCFWLLLFLTNIFVVWSLFLDSSKQGIANDVRFTVRITWFLFVAVEFILSCIGEDVLSTEKYGLNPNPARNASFLNQITYWWFNYMGYLGWKKPLEQKDIYDILPEDQAHESVVPLQKNWDTEMQHMMKAKASGKVYRPSLLKALFKTYWKTLAFTCLLRLATDAFGFATPQILQLIIGFVEAGTEESWKGYFYAVLMFSAMLLQSILVNWYMYNLFRMGMRAKGAVTAMIYRKALKITSAEKQASSVGEIVNHMSVDAQRFMDFMGFFHTLWSAPLQIAVALYFLYALLGYAMFAGLITLILTLPVNAFAFSHVRILQNSQMKEKDKRIKLMTEILNGIKVLKLYAWELPFQREILDIRHRELTVLKKSAYYGALSYTLFVMSPFLVALSIFVTYVLMDSNNVLTASVIFPAMALINILRVPMTLMSPAVMIAIQTRISETRLTKFFQNEELDLKNVEELSPSDPNDILIQDGTFSWSKERSAACLNKINLKVKRGELLAVVGRVGCGKSSLCSAMLGLMEKNSGRVAVKGKVAYVPQQAWIQNLTVKENILFGSKYDPVFYHKVIDACALKSDLEILPAGDETEIGEKGANMSGGQRQRISLARAVYMNADVYILDDPLSAVDAHVGKHIFENVIGPNGMLRNKTRILVTHGIGFLPQADEVVVLTQGTISETGSYRQMLQNNGPFAEFLRQYMAEEHEPEEQEDDLEASVKEELMEELPVSQKYEEVKRRQSTTSLSSLRRVKSMLQRGTSRVSTSPKHADEKEKAPLVPQQDPSKGKLVEEEKAQTGVVKWEVYFMFAKQMTYKTTAALLILYAIYSGLGTGANFWLTEWSLDEKDPKRLTTEWRDYRLGVYGAFALLQGIFIAGFSVAMAQARVKASKNLHQGLLSRIMRAPMYFFDQTPLGRIINRFSRDVDTVDVLIPGNIEFWLYNVFGVVSTLIVICISTPPFAIVLIPLAAFYYFMQRFFISTSRQLKRLESISRSPIYSHFQESITGNGVIIATKQTDRFIHTNEKMVDRNNTSLFLIIAANRWITVRLEIIGNFITFFASLFAVIGRDQNWGISSETIGLSISYALQINVLLNWLLWITSELESNIVAVERIKEYTEVPQEAAWTLPGVSPGDNWPDMGVISFRDYQTRYREGLDLVLKGLTANVGSGEKVGIVGRTGAGKSSLTLALFRIIEAAGGQIDIDGTDISKLGLHDVRSRITILPQEPVLFTGTLRLNLDPFRNHSDQEIWDALEHAHLKPFVSALPEGLDHNVVDGGENYSVGQRQLICLARALLRRTKILVLDEATAAIDLHTDDLIQQTIRDKFADCTILTIAHRIATIMDSTKIMVLDQGKVREYASPSELLSDKSSIFYSLAKTANLVA